MKSVVRSPSNLGVEPGPVESVPARAALTLGPGAGLGPAVGSAFPAKLYGLTVLPDCPAKLPGQAPGTIGVQQPAPGSVP